MFSDDYYTKHSEPSFECTCGSRRFVQGVTLSLKTGQILYAPIDKLWNCLGCGNLWTNNQRPQWELMREGKKA